MNEPDKLQSVFDSEEWKKTSELFREAMDTLEKEQESFWNSLSKEDQLNAFCAVVRRIYEGEVKNRTSYRGVLYDVFDFDYDAYAPAQVAGYLDIHNIMYDGIHLDEVVRCYSDAMNNIKAITTDERILNIIKEVTNK